MTVNYQADEYQREAQRFVCPLYMRDGLGGFDFSSTATFLSYRDEPFCLFAAHALPLDKSDLSDIGVLKTDGNFQALAEIAVAFQIHREEDLVVCLMPARFEGKNYFRLDYESPTLFKTDSFGWIGFPKKKATQKYRRTKADPSYIASELSELDDGFLKWENARFLLIGARLDSLDGNEVVGHFSNQNVTYEYEGYKQQGYSLRGMSGGAFFHGPEKLAEDWVSPDDLFWFVGIGLEYQGDKIRGVSRELLVGLLEQQLEGET